MNRTYMDKQIELKRIELRTDIKNIENFISKKIRIGNNYILLNAQKRNLATLLTDSGRRKVRLLMTNKDYEEEAVHDNSIKNLSLLYMNTYGWIKSYSERKAKNKLKELLK